MFQWFSREKKSNESQESPVEQEKSNESLVEQEKSNESHITFLLNEIKKLREELDQMKRKTNVILYYDGTLYIGDTTDNKPNGFGTICHSSGSRYIGEWKDGLYHGQGTYYENYYSAPFSTEWVNHVPVLPENLPEK